MLRCVYANYAKPRESVAEGKVSLGPKAREDTTVGRCLPALRACQVCGLGVSTGKSKFGKSVFFQVVKTCLSSGPSVGFDLTPLRPTAVEYLKNTF
jgi:hypothetical protein